MLHAQIKGRIARRIEERVRHLSTPLASFQKGGVWAPFLFNLGGWGAGGGVVTRVTWVVTLGGGSGHFGQSYIKWYLLGDFGANVNNIKPEEYRRSTLSFHQEYGKSYC